MIKKIPNSIYLAISFLCLSYIMFTADVSESRYDIEPVGHKKFSVLHRANFVYAAENGDYTTVDKYLNLGMPANAQDHKNDTALMGACLNGHNDIIKLLLKNNADPSLRNNDGYSAIDFSKIQERHKIASILETLNAPSLERTLSSHEDK